MFLTTGLAIALIAGVIGFSYIRLVPYNFRWFLQLRRPRWLTIEKWIPFIWTFIFICGIISATYVWQAQPSQWWLMAAYAVLELLILSYTPVLCRLRSLTAGTIVGALGFVWGAFLTNQVWTVSQVAGYFLVPFLLWSPIGTYVTWAMIRINPGAR
jgi:translocator protein